MKLDLGKWYRVLAPRPVVLVSTVDAKGVSNAAPFSFVMPCSAEPPLITFASAPGHHTAKNILSTKDFVVNVPGQELLKKLWTCAFDFEAGVSEIEKAGLTEKRSSRVRSPGISECLARFECRLFKSYTAGDHLLIIGEVLRADVKDEYFSENEFLIGRAKPLMHIGGPEFGLLGKIIKVKK